MPKHSSVRTPSFPQQEKEQGSTLTEAGLRRYMFGVKESDCVRCPFQTGGLTSCYMSVHILPPSPEDERFPPNVLGRDSRFESQLTDMLLVPVADRLGVSGHSPGSKISK